jgi:hypothetical protein
VERVEEGRQVLAVPACERVPRLRALLDAAPQDATTKRLVTARTETQLQQRWAAVAARGARYQDVVAYHVTEAELICEVQRVERERERVEEDADYGACCKVCSKGYACGDSCISRSKNCHKGPGCACDG